MTYDKHLARGLLTSGVSFRLFEFLSFPQNVFYTHDVYGTSVDRAVHKMQTCKAYHEGKYHLTVCL